MPRTNQSTLGAQACDGDEIKCCKKTHVKPEPCVQWEVTEPEKSECMVQKDLIWEMAHASAFENSQVPAWGGFNALVSEREIPLTRICDTLQLLNDLYDTAKIG